MSDLFILKIIRICECGFKKYLCQGGCMSRGDSTRSQEKARGVGEGLYKGGAGGTQ